MAAFAADSIAASGSRRSHASSARGISRACCLATHLPHWLDSFASGVSCDSCCDGEKGFDSCRLQNKVFRGREKPLEIGIVYLREFKQDMAATFSSAVS